MQLQYEPILWEAKGKAETNFSPLKRPKLVGEQTLGPGRFRGRICEDGIFQKQEKEKPDIDIGNPEPGYDTSFDFEESKSFAPG